MDKPLACCSTSKRCQSARRASEVMDQILRFISLGELSKEWEDGTRWELFDA
jgi:hypothetical protein